MANKTIWKAVLNDEGVPQFPAGAYGRIRLWIESEPPEPTDFWILIGDYDVTDTAKFKTVKSKDSKKVDDKVNAIFKRAKVGWKNYDKNNSVHMDIHVPKELIDGYAD